MKYLSFSQPWLWAILNAGKAVENRSWPPPIAAIGQRIALHAAQSWNAAGISTFIRFGIEHPQRRALYPSGAIVGVATIDRVVTISKTLEPDQARWFFESRADEKQNYGWILSDVIALPEAIPMKGGQGLRYLAPAIVVAIEEQLPGVISIGRAIVGPTK